MKRRAFLSTFLGGAAALRPVAAAAQLPGVPIVGLLDLRSPEAIADRLRAFRQGLKDAGYVEGENVVIAYRWAEDRVDRLSELATDLVRRNVAVIATAGDGVPLAVKAATTTIPVVFIVSQDPIRLGLVASLARPDGNLTGINFVSGELTAKRLEFFRELLPAVARVAVLVNPTNPAASETALRDVEVAAAALGLQIQVINASTSREIDAGFAALARGQSAGLLITNDPFFTTRRVQLVSLAARHAVPAAYGQREFAEIGGLLSYASKISDAWRQCGIYVGRILKGAKPADLPVVQASKFELVINAQTARMLGLTVPQSLLQRADEVIE